MARSDRKARRAEIRKKREERREERQYLLGLIHAEYEPGDDAEALREKIQPMLRARARGDGDLLIRLLAIFERLLPIILKLFMGI